ncbi:MAG: ABC transporter ATP-binding protein, partial [Verrucomicrobiota bacterium]
MKRFFPYYRYLLPHKWAFFGAVVCAILYGASTGLGFPLVMKYNLPIIFGGEANDDLPFMTRLFGEQPDPDTVLLVTVLLLPLVILIRSLSGFFNAYLIAHCGVKVLEGVRTELFAKLQRLTVGYFQTRNRGDLVSRMLADCNLVKTCIVEVSNNLIREPITFLFAVGSVVYFSIESKQYMFILFCLIVIPLCILPIRFIGKMLKKKALLMQAQAGEMTECLTENLGAVREIRAFGLEDSQMSRFRKAVNHFLRLQMKVVKYDKSLGPVIELVTGLVITAAVYVAARNRVGLEAEIVLPLFLALHFSYVPIKKLGAISNQIKKGLASLDRIEEVLEEPVSVMEPVNPTPLPEPVRGSLRFEQVTFQYGEEPVLTDLSCELEAGKCYALVGPSGAGKSTFIQLVMRFYDPVKGSISLDGIDLRDVGLKELRHQMALVPQDPVLFNDTILENIRLGDLEASPQAIEAAARQANAHDFILETEEGYDTEVGDKGTRLSGGQKQRIA